MSKERGDEARATNRRHGHLRVLRELHDVSIEVLVAAAASPRLCPRFVEHICASPHGLVMGILDVVDAETDLALVVGRPFAGYKAKCR